MFSLVRSRPQAQELMFYTNLGRAYTEVAMITAREVVVRVNRLHAKTTPWTEADTAEMDELKKMTLDVQDKRQSAGQHLFKVVKINPGNQRALEALGELGAEVLGLSKAHHPDERAIERGCPLGSSAASLFPDMGVGFAPTSAGPADGFVLG